MGADLVVDHTKDIVEQLAAASIPSVDMVFSTTNTNKNLPWIARLIRPFGHVSLIDVMGPIDPAPLVTKSASLHLEVVFSKILGGGDLRSQALILERVAAHVLTGQVHPIVTKKLAGLTVQSMREAHELIETRRTVGKIVIAV